MKVSRLNAAGTRNSAIFGAIIAVVIVIFVIIVIVYAQRSAKRLNPQGNTNALRPSLPSTSGNLGAQGIDIGKIRRALNK